MTTDPASLLPSIACDDCGVASGLCVYTSGPNAGKPRAARYGPHKVRLDDSTLAARWYDRGVSAGAVSRQPDVDAARSRAESAEGALGACQAEFAAYKDAHPDETPRKHVGAVVEPWKFESQAWMKQAMDPAQAATFSGGLYVTRGAFHRDIATNGPATGEWQASHYAVEADAMLAAGIDVAFLDVTTPSATNTNWKRCLSLAAAGLSKGLAGVPMIDGNGNGIAGKTAMPVADVAKALLGFYKAGYGRVDGKPWISSFKAEFGTHPDGTKHTIEWAVAWWKTLLEALEAGLGEPVKFIACALDPNTLDELAPLADVLSWWGPARPGNVARLATYAAAAEKLGKDWMAPVRFQDVRSYSSDYAENGNTDLLRATWAAAADAAWVQVVTWNDFAENTQVCPSRNNGTALSALTKFYSDAYRAGVAPRVTKDRIVLTHRTQPAAAVHTKAGVKPETCTLDGSAAPRDTVEALVFATAPADLTICGTAATVPAGISWPTVPLKVGPAGSVTATLTRAGTPVASVVSPFAVTDKPLVPDHTYRVVGS